MTVPAWQPGTIYQPGATVIPLTQVAPTLPTIAPDNPGFESGDVGWTHDASWDINNTSQSFTGDWAAEAIAIGTSVIINDNAVPVTPGQSITANCQVRQGSAPAGDNTGKVLIRWYTSGMVLISDSSGNVVSSSGATGWKQSTVTATAPANAAFAAIGASVTKTVFNSMWVDTFTWTYSFAGQTATSGLIYRATQADAALSADVEPVWPLIVGGTVVDGGVTWEAALANRVTYKAYRIFTTGAVEPTWPEVLDETVPDGTGIWKAVPLRITDENCPNTKVVAIGADKVFAEDNDVMRFSVTLNARDWTTSRDAGFLPSGLRQSGQIGITVTGNYRGNLVIWNASNFQMWQVDPDPALMALLDNMQGIGSTQRRAVQAVANDLFFAAALGVRSVSLTAGTQNLSAGDVGMPIDPLYKAAVIAAASEESAIGTYYPSAGQYWLAFSDTGELQPDGTFDPPTPLSIEGTLPDEEENTEYEHTLQIIGGVGPYTVEVISGSLPPDGTAVVVADEIVVTFPSDAVCQHYPMVLQVTDADGRTATTYQNPEITTTLAVSGTLPDALIGEAYDETLPITGGVQPYVSVTIIAGALPAGGTAVIDGTNIRVQWPGTAPVGDYDVTFEVEDSNACTTTNQQTPSIAGVWWLVSNDLTVFSSLQLSERLWRAAIPGDWGVVTNSVARSPLAVEPPEAAGFLGEACFVFGQSGQAEKYTSFVAASPQAGSVVSLVSPAGLPSNQGVIHKRGLRAWTSRWVSNDGGATTETIQAPTGGNADGQIQAITERDDGRWLITMGRDGGGDLDLWYSDVDAPQDGDWTDIGQIGSPTVSCSFFLRNDTHICGFGNSLQGMLRTSSLTAGASWTNVAYSSAWDGNGARCGFSEGGTMIVGTNGGTNARIMRSTNGGSSWTAVATGTADGGIINNDIISIQRGGGRWVATTTSNLSGGDYARIFMSEDDGLTWAEVDNPTSAAPSPSNEYWIPFFVGGD